jgi:hypothetical protein
VKGRGFRTAASYGEAVIRTPLCATILEDSRKEDWMTRQSMVWLLGVVVGFLALIGVGASAQGS